MMVIQPTGGLCNRLRMLDSARLLSQRLDQPLELIWTLGPELNCGFGALLEPLSGVTVTETASPPPPASWLGKKLDFVKSYAHYRCQFRCVIFQSRMDRLIRRSFDFTRLGRYDSIFITCCNRFYRPQRKLQPIVPVASIRQTVNKYVTQFGDAAIGVHIRRTDHHTVAAFSPEQGFIDAMNAQLQSEPGTKFFLATDSPDVMSRFASIFGDRVLWHPKTYDRDSEKGIQDALIDLLCLSQTKKIIGSGLSSFSETAAQLTDIPITYIRSA